MDASERNPAPPTPPGPPPGPVEGASTPPDGALAWAAAALGVAAVSSEAVPGAAGARRYWRLTDPSGASSILMWARREDEAILPPALRHEPYAIPFLDVAAFLASQRVPVPEVRAFDTGRRLVLVEDLGRVHLADLQGPQRERAHEAAIALLAGVHGIEAPPGPAPIPFQRSFDAEWIQFEVDLFLGLDWSAQTRRELRAAMGELVERMVALPQVVSLRDYQSQNLMLDAAGRLRVLDFQDALLAPQGLDLAALLFDSYVRLEREERARLLELYALLAPRAVSAAELAVSAIQRKAKDLSRFHRLVHVKRDLRYEQPRVRATASVRDACADLPADLASVSRTLDRALSELPG